MMKGPCSPFIGKSEILLRMLENGQIAIYRAKRCSVFAPRFSNSSVPGGPRARDGCAPAPGCAYARRRTAAFHPFSARRRLCVRPLPGCIPAFCLHAAHCPGEASDDRPPRKPSRPHRSHARLRDAASPETSIHSRSLPSPTHALQQKRPVQVVQGVCCKVGRSSLSTCFQEITQIFTVSATSW